ncbi:MAG TPA: S8 family serine peptidase [Blastocatellia bacterium]|nr:S8 family serine peptidase [Blastocatellia bacterium]
MMIKPLAFLALSFVRKARPFVALCMTLAVLSVTLPRSQAQAPSTGGPLGKLSLALQQSLNNNDARVWANASRQTVRALIQTNGAVTAALRQAITLAGGTVVRQFSSIDGLLAELPKSRLLDIAGRADVERISADHLAQQSASHLEAATGADLLRAYKPLTDSFNGLDGSGVGIAILDSGIMAGHNDFTGLLGLTTRVTASTDIVSSNTNLALFEGVTGLLGGLLPILNPNKDGYGHGSHVAGAAAGRNAGNNNSRGYEGVAPNASLIDVRVLDGRGLGQTSDVIAGIDWCVANQASKNIKVMNLSLGAASTDSYVADPLCRAVRRAVAAGIVVVAAAGNYGQSADGLEQYGSITAPGNDPTVITVGAANTHQTDARGDESVTYFSSRGPSRSYARDAAGVKHYDNLLKPDLVAPGNRVVSVESKNSWLAANYPQLHAGGNGNSAFMQLSGTSIAAPVVAGAAALLLQKNPGLTPPLVKAILQYTAQQVPGANIVQQGAGLLNVEGAARLAGALRTDIAQAITRGTIHVGDTLLARGATMPVPISILAGQSVPWGGYVFAGGAHLLAGAELFKRYQAIYDPSLVWARGCVTLDESPVSNMQLITAGVIDADVVGDSTNVFTLGGDIAGGVASGQGHLIANGVAISEGHLIANGVVMSEGITLAEGHLIANGVAVAEGVTLAEGHLIANGVAQAEAVNLGESW